MTKESKIENNSRSYYENERCGSECPCDPDCSCKTSDFGCERHDEEYISKNYGNDIPLSVLAHSSSRPELMSAIRNLYHSDNIETVLKYASIEELREILIERSSKIALSEIISVAQPEDIGEWLTQFGIIDEDGILNENYRDKIQDPIDELFINIEDDDGEDGKSCCPIIRHKCSIAKIAVAAVLFFGIKKLIKR